MRPQNLPQLNFGQYLSEIINSKHTSKRRRLRKEQNQILTRAADFTQALSALTSLPTVTWKNLTSEALKACYGSSTLALTGLKDAILNELKAQGSVNLERCPYCMLRTPSTWDHYFPQAHYPEYSVYHHNLIYTCADCNHEKSATYCPANLQFVHPYYYGTPTEIILFCKATIDAGKLALQFYSAPSKPELTVLASIGQRHLTNLKLEKEFQIEGATLINDFLSSIKQEFPNGVDSESLNRLLSKNYHNVRMAYGPNAWEARMWHAVANLPSFDLYVNAQLPLLPYRQRPGLAQIAPPLLP